MKVMWEKAIKDSGVDRKEVFITSKLWLQDYGYEKCEKRY